MKDLTERGYTGAGAALIVLASMLVGGCETLKAYAPDSWVTEAFDAVSLEVAEKAFDKYVDVIEDNGERLSDAQRATYSADKIAVAGALEAAHTALGQNDAGAFAAQSDIIRDGLESMRNTIIAGALDSIRSQ